MKKSILKKTGLFFKRTFDIFGSFFALIVLSPLLVFCALVTSVSSHGEFLFKQKRLGKNKKVFYLLKFRSMHKEAKQIAPENLSIEEKKKMTTPWGRFMRKTSLDELPQLFNILVGDMSFIGPRPGQIEEIEADLVQERDSYLPSPYDVRPGLGGYAQVKMHRGHDAKQKAAYDCYYVQHLSLSLDIKIFVISLLSFVGYDSGR